MRKKEPQQVLGLEQRINDSLRAQGGKARSRVARREV